MAIDFAGLLAAEKAKREGTTVNAAPVPSVPATPVAPAAPSSVQPSVTAHAVNKELPGSNSAQGAAPIINNAPPPVSTPVEYPGLVDLQERILNLDKALLAKHPAMDSLLQSIHRNLQKDPELVHMLKPEDTAIIFRALQNKTQTTIVTETVKSASSGRGKGLKNLGLEDL